MNESEYAALVDAGTQIISEGEGDERLLAYLRESGATKTDSIMIVRAVKSLSLKAADDLVHYSAVWSDRREQDEAALDAFLDSVGRRIHIDDLGDDE